MNDSKTLSSLYSTCLWLFKKNYLQKKPQPTQPNKQHSPVWPEQKYFLDFHVVLTQTYSHKPQKRDFTIKESQSLFCGARKNILVALLYLRKITSYSDFFPRYSWNKIELELNRKKEFNKWNFSVELQVFLN